MKELLDEIKKCEICDEALPHRPNPVVKASQTSRLLIIGQAPGKRVHESGIPWNDPSGDQLRLWLGLSKEIFYDVSNMALVPMGFCYPGKGKSGDLPPRPECAAKWHLSLLNQMKEVRLTLLIGVYAQRYYLTDRSKKNLTETVKAYKEYLPDFFPLPHPSPRNRIWLKKNSWFSEDVLPHLKEKVVKLF